MNYRTNTLDRLADLLDYLAASRDAAAQYPETKTAIGARRGIGEARLRKLPRGRTAPMTTALDYARTEDLVTVTEYEIGNTDRYGNNPTARRYLITDKGETVRLGLRPLRQESRYDSDREAFEARHHDSNARYWQRRAGQEHHPTAEPWVRGQTARYGSKWRDPYGGRFGRDYIPKPSEVNPKRRHLLPEEVSE